MSCLLFFLFLLLKLASRWRTIVDMSTGALPYELTGVVISEATPNPRQLPDVRSCALRPLGGPQDISLRSREKKRKERGRGDKCQDN